MSLTSTWTGSEVDATLADVDAKRRDLEVTPPQVDANSLDVAANSLDVDSWSLDVAANSLDVDVVRAHVDASRRRGGVGGSYGESAVGLNNRRRIAGGWGMEPHSCWCARMFARNETP